jgi:very-short-patch-repair endonuclease
MQFSFFQLSSFSSNDVYSKISIALEMNHKLYNKKELKAYRIALRNKSTSAEVALWNFLKNSQLGRKFRRQHSIGNYITDFCCPSEKLIIELDGNVHGEYSQIEKDEMRDKYLEDLGFRILRFENRLVFQEPDYVLNEIMNIFTNKP